MRYILGIDQGGTKTVAILADGQGRILGYSVGDGAYYPSDGMEHTMSIIRDVSCRAAKVSGVSLSAVEFAVIGMTGMDFPCQQDPLTAELKQTLGMENVLVVNDCIIAMYGGTRCRTSAVICAGTGLNMAVRAGGDKEFIYGFYIEEKTQGGSALAKRAVRKVFDSELGLCAPTRLTELFLKEFHAKDPDDLLYLSETDPTFYTQAKLLVPQIISVAADEDEITNRLLEEMSAEMTGYLICGLRKLHLQTSPLDVVLSGSVLKGTGNLFTEYLRESILKSAPNATVVSARYEPAVGAVVMALDRFEGMTPDVRNNLERTAGTYRLIR